MQANINQSLLNRANAAMRRKEYSSAIALYEQALAEADHAVQAQIQFNLDLARQRMGMPLSLTTIEIEKPEGLDEFCFNLIKQGRFFDPAWYLAQYKDRHHIAGNLLAHYLEQGIALSTNPSPHFDTAYYLKTHQDVASSGMHPFLHYIFQGYKEDRVTKPTASDDSLDQYLVEAPRYVPRLAPNAPPFEKVVRAIAFYLPQFHSIPENDAWWGKGFTEWTNVNPAKPQFAGHYQPHVPDDFLGHYDLRDTVVMRKQIELAKQYGIEGYCFYTYWFGGKRLLEKPVENYLKDKTLDLPFCLCWANENWSRRWDGLESEILMAQQHSPEDDLAFIQSVAAYMSDPRYIRVDGKPLLLVYRPSLLPSAKETANRWRDWCRQNSIGEVFLAYTQSFEAVDPVTYGFDAAIEFPPNNSAPPNITAHVEPLAGDFAATVYDWRELVERSKNYKTPDYKLFRGVCPAWDNTARRKNKGSILLHSSPQGYQEWLYSAIADTRKRFMRPDERLIFINAWNEWAEGAHLEPDKRYGYAYLEATRMAHIRADKSVHKKTDKLAIVVHAFYEDVFAEIIERLNEIKCVAFKLFITTPHDQSARIDAKLKASGFPYFIMPVENRGRDILPFLKISAKVLEDGYAYILKVHTKKSNHRQDGDIWRQDLYSKLLNEDSMRKAMNSFENDANLGLIGPTGHIVTMDFYWGSNARNVEALAIRLGQTADSIKALNFVAGTMFFARVDALSPMLNLAISESEFETEAGQVDGTLAHALERAIAISCSAKSYEITNTDMNRTENSSKNYRFVSKEN
jgi:lipopolysaccharide biosynthesis protein